MGYEALLYLLLLLASTLLLYILPYIPAIIEWRYKQDALPPKVFLDRTLADYIVRMFKVYIQKNYAPLIEKCRASKTTHEMKNKDGTGYLIMGDLEFPKLTNAEIAAKNSQRDIIFCQDGAIPSDMLFTKKIYGVGAIEIQENTAVNELWANDNIVLNTGVSVKTLVYSEDAITIHPHCHLDNYCRAKKSIHFLGHADFQYLYAPRIEFGHVIRKLIDRTVNVIFEVEERQIYQEKLIIPAKNQLIKNLIVKAPLVIRADCAIKGNIKCYDTLQIENDTHIVGAIFCHQDIVIGEGCTIQGPIVTSGAIHFAKNCVIGTRKTMTSVIAAQIFIAEGCVVSGMILAKMQGSYNPTLL